MATLNKKEGNKNGKIVKVSKVSQQICRLHTQLEKHARSAVTKAMQIGELLVQEQEKIGWGGWEQWINDNLSFTPRMARKYILLWKNKDRLKSVLSSEISLTLTEALRLLTDPENQIRDITRAETKKWRKEYADKEITCDNPAHFLDSIHVGDNRVVLTNMKDEAEGKITLVVTSPPYNCNKYYSQSYNDDKAYTDYLDSLVEPFSLYTQLLRPGGRVIYNVGSIVKNKAKDEEGQPYFHLLADDLCRRVHELDMGFKFYDKIVWYKPNRDPLDNNKWGTFADPERPIMRSQLEYVIVWSYKQFSLPNINNIPPDITPDEFKDWSINVWNISSNIKRNPSPAAFPPRLVERILKIYSRPGDWVIDPYSGSGTTCIECKRLGRHFTGIDLNPAYSQWAQDKLGA